MEEILDQPYGARARLSYGAARALLLQCSRTFQSTYLL